MDDNQILFPAGLTQFTINLSVSRGPDDNIVVALGRFQGKGLTIRDAGRDLARKLSLMSDNESLRTTVLLQSMFASEKESGCQ